MSEYVKQANDFAKKYGVKLTVLDRERGIYFSDDKHPRYVFKLKLTRKGKQYTFKFGQSYAEGSKEPDMYTVLSCLTKYDPYSFEDFCSEFGYNQYNDYGRKNKKAYKTYLAVEREWKAVERMFGDCLEELCEIA